MQNPENVQVLQVEHNIDLLPSGTGMQDSLGLLNRSDLSIALHKWGQDYDILIIDSPPLLAIADGLVLGKAVDHVLLIVEHGKTSAAAIKHTLRRSGNADVNILGFVMNKIDLTQKADGYQYSYSYGPKS